MKIRPVWCMHVAVYAFSVLVLVTSAVSYFRLTTLQWGTDQSAIVVKSGFGHIVWMQWPGPATGEIAFERVTVPWTTQLVQEFQATLRHMIPPSHDTYRCLGVTVIAQVEEPTDYYPQRICIVPYFTLLIPPIVWMSGFYLVKLLRHFRAAPADSPSPRSLPDVPSVQ
jgi:hypothetical protein